MSKRKTILFWVQHLLGIGHLRRARAISSILIEAGHSVTVVEGGMPIPGIDFPGAERVALPPVKSDADFSALYTDTGAVADDAFMTARRDRLVALGLERRPDIVLLEGWPLARRKFSAEIVPLLEALQSGAHRPRVVTSLRDILVDKGDPKKAAKMVALAERWVDRLLVHGDPTVARLEDSFPTAAMLTDKVRYTGYIADRRPLSPPIDGAGRGEILVSAGGGAVGARLYRSAVAAGRLWPDGPPWRLLLGPQLPDADRLEFMQAASPPNLIVEQARPDFPGLLMVAAASISQAGYNTAMDLLRTGCPALLIPFGEGGESEQRLRAEHLSRSPGFSSLSPVDLSAEALVGSVRSLLPQRRLPPPPNKGEAAREALLQALLEP